jgi:hypothetical protein
VKKYIRARGLIFQVHSIYAVHINAHLDLPNKKGTGDSQPYTKTRSASTFLKQFNATRVRDHASSYKHDSRLTSQKYFHAFRVAGYINEQHFIPVRFISIVTKKKKSNTTLSLLKLTATCFGSHKAIFRLSTSITQTSRILLEKLTRSQQVKEKKKINSINYMRQKTVKRMRYIVSGTKFIHYCVPLSNVYRFNTKRTELR